MIKKLEETTRPAEIAIYIEALSHTGMMKVIPVMSEFAFGTARTTRNFTPRLVEFTKAMAIHALHNVALRYPEDVSRHNFFIRIP